MCSFDKRHTLIILAALSLAGYALLPLFFPLLSQYYHAPLRDIRFFAPSPWGGLAYASMFLLLYAIYARAYQHVNRQGAGASFILGATVLFSLPLLLTYPINATDVFRYFIRGRVTGFYGESALMVPPSEFSQDPYLPLAGEWAGETSPYGPFWELVAAGVTVVSGQNLFLSLLIFKALGIVAHSSIGLIIWKALETRSGHYRAAMTLLWSWNPALLFMFAVDGHNDALMMLWLVLGFVVMGRHPLPGYLIAVLGALTKPIGALALPLLFLGHWRRLERWSARWRFLLFVAIGTTILSLAAFAPFGSLFDLALRLLTEASEAAGFSPGVVVVLVAQRLALPVETGTMIEAVTLIGFALFALITLWIAWRGMRVTLSIAAVFGSYLITAMTFRIWYSAWPFVWLIFDEGRRMRSLTVAVWFLFTAHLSILIYGHLRVHALSGDQLIAHLIGVPFTFLLPILLARRFPFVSER